MSNLTFPLDLAVLEQIPRNVRRTKVVRLARGLNSADQQELTNLLCENVLHSSPVTAVGANDASGKNVDAMKRVLQDDDDVDTNDPTTNYYLQEIGMLVAAATSNKQELLRLARAKNSELISRKALALAVHSPNAVSDSDISTLCAMLGERDKKKLVRACAHEPKREQLATQFIHDWLLLETTTEDRKMVACELLHAVAPNTSWFPEALRQLFARGRIAEAQGKSKHIDSQCFRAVRRDLLWRRHGSTLMEMLREDLVAQQGRVVGHFVVFNKYHTLLDTAQWTVPGQKTIPQQMLANISACVPWKQLFDLYFAYLPFTPIVSSSSSAEMWALMVAGAPVPAMMENAVQRDALEYVQTLVEFTPEWTTKLIVHLPAWLFAKPMLRKLDSISMLQAYSKLTRDGIIPKRFDSLCSTLLNQALLLIPVKHGFSNEVFAQITATVKQSFACATKRAFYNGLYARESFETEQEYDLHVEQVSTHNTVLSQLCYRVLAHNRITLGQQLDLFSVLHTSSRTLLKLTPADFPANDDLFMVGPQRIKSMIAQYEEFFQPYTALVMGSVAGKLKLAVDRGKPTQQLNQVFASVFDRGMMQIQNDVEEIYSALAGRYPLVFAQGPVDKLLTVFLPKLQELSLKRDFELETDEPQRICDTLFRIRVLPNVIQESSKLFCDSGTRHQYGKYAGAEEERHRSNEILVALATESMETVRLTKFNQVLSIAQAFYTGTISMKATNAWLDYLEQWISVARNSTQRAKQALAARVNDGHPTRVPNSERSLEALSAHLHAMLNERCKLLRENEWCLRKQQQPQLDTLIQRIVRLWSRATFEKNPFDPGCNSFDPYRDSNLVAVVNQLPFRLREPFQPTVRKFFLLRLHGEVESNGVRVTAPAHRRAKDSAKQPWMDASDFFQTSFANCTEGAHDVLTYLEQNSKVSTYSFIKSLDRFANVRDASTRKRLEADLSKSMFADRQQCMYTLLECSIKSKSLQEISRTLQRIALQIENETHDNRMQVLTHVLSQFASRITPLVLPSAQSSSSTTAAALTDRAYVQFLHSPPAEDQWPMLIDAGDRLPQTLFKLLDDMLDSTDEKQESNFRLFRTVSDELFKRALAWPCTMLFRLQDKRIAALQQVWFDCAMDIQFKLSCYRSGKTSATTTFRPMLGSSTQSAVKQFIFDAGYQMDVAYPTADAAQIAAYRANAAVRRKEMAQHVAHLFDSAYLARLGPAFQAKPGTPLQRKPAMEKKRALDMLSMVQGEWVHCPTLHARIVDVVEQCQESKQTSKGHQNQVANLMQALTEASATWGLRCRDAKPKWARGSSSAAAAAAARPSKLPKQAANAPEDLAWCTEATYEFLPSVIPRYWKLMVDTFGIYHPQGESFGRCVLRMHLRYSMRHVPSASRAQRQTIRVNTALALLQVCPSAIHLHLVQAVLRDFRQDLLVQHVFSHPVDSLVLGKFSPVPANEDDEGGAVGENMSSDGEDDDDGAHGKLDRLEPFRMHGFYGFEQLTYAQGRCLANVLIADCEDSNAGTMKRVRSVNRLTFLPCVGHADFASMLARHYEHKTAYLLAVKQKKKNLDNELIVPTNLPLPESVVDTLFQAILQDSNPLSLLALLDPEMMQKSSSRTTVRVAERMCVLLAPSKVLQLIHILLSRKGRDALQVGPVKALLRIVFVFALERDSVVGSEVISTAKGMVTRQWSRRELHPDARIVLLTSALRACAAASHKDTCEFAWQILSEVSGNTEHSNKLRAILTCVDPHTDVFPGDTAAKLVSGQATCEFVDLVQEISKLSRCTMNPENEPRFLDLLLQARETCKQVEQQAASAGKEAKLDVRKQRSLQKQVRNSQAVLALLTVDLIRWVGDVHVDNAYRVFEVLEQAISSTVSNAPTGADEHVLGLVYSNTLPNQLAMLANHTFQYLYTVPDRSAAKQQAFVQRVLEVNSKWITALLEVDLTQHQSRLMLANRLKSFASELTQTTQDRVSKHSLYQSSFALPFRIEIDQLKKEYEVSRLLASFLPEVRVDG